MKKRTYLPVFRRKRIALAVAACFCLSPALANPNGAQVITGGATLSTQGSTLTISNSPGAIINWQGFSIGAGETTRFNQPSAASSVLNRVVANNPSQLLGKLQSNGRVFLINPAGILVGAGAAIDTAGLVVSTLNLSDADFLAGRLNFTATPGAGKVENYGSISTPSGGSVYLVGTQVENHGIINAPNGEVLLAAGKTAQLIDTATPGVRVEITADDEQALNVGQILAQAGRIGMLGAIVRNQGKLSASSVVNEGGRIFLKATQDAYVEGSGSLEATGRTGGQIDVLGQRVALLDDARVDASGTQGGGAIRVGGDYQGKNADVPNATISYVADRVTLKADASETGNGGKVIVWADDTTRFYGDISAKGGAQAGDGGFVEVSGKSTLDFRGTVSTAAARGNKGTLLLDPSGVTISSSASSGDMSSSTPFVSNAYNTSSILNVGVLQSALAGNNVTVDGRGSGASGSPGNVTVDAPVTWSSTSTLLLLSGNDGAIAINQAISAANGGLALNAGSGGVSQSSAGTITAKTLAINSLGEVNLATAQNRAQTVAANLAGSGKAFSLRNAADFAVGQGSVGATAITGITTNNGAISLSGSGKIAVNENISAGSAAVSLSAAGDITLGAAVSGGSQVNATSTGGAILGTNGNSVQGGTLAFVAATGIGSNDQAIKVAATTSVSAQTTSGDVYLDANNSDVASGNLNLGAVSAAGTVKLSAFGAIVDANGDSTNITANSARLSAATGIGSSDAIETRVSSIGATNSSSGNVRISNTGALTTDAEVGVSAAGTGGVTIETHSPLTIGLAGVSAGGDIVLSAGATGTGATGDNLTINGPVTSSAGSVTLRAGNSITGSGTVTAGSGRSVTRTANLNPAAPLPTLTQCISNPALAGCSTVLPTLASCTTVPSTPGCSVVLPTLAACTTTPTAAGCSAVLPTIATCTTAPSTPGCSVVLPTVTTCTTTPTTPGCSAVLPTLATCTTAPSTPGCSAVLPTVATCTTTPAAAGCSTVLPTLATCTAAPSAAGCSAVLPTLATCTTTPTAAGCSAVLPTLATCTAAPSTPGCSVVLPSSVDSSVVPLHLTQVQIVNGLEMAVTTVSPSSSSSPGSPSPLTQAQVLASQMAAVPAGGLTPSSPTQTLAGGVVGGETPNTFGSAAGGSSPESGSEKSHDAKTNKMYCN